MQKKKIYLSDFLLLYLSHLNKQTDWIDDYFYKIWDRR